MKTHLIDCSVLAAFLVAVVFLVSTPGAAQNGAPAAKPSCIGCSVDGKTTPRTSDGHPDLSGYWNNNAFNDFVERTEDGSLLYNFGGGPAEKRSAYGFTGYAPGEQTTQPSYKPEFAAKVKAIADSEYGATTPLDPQFDCKPLGVPRSMESPFQIVQTPALTVILYESPDKVGQTFRPIYTDGRPHPADLETTYLGHSIGHWDGDALVVDVIALDDETWLGSGGTAKYAMLHSNQEHVVERYSRNGDTLTYEATVYDPVMFTQPWVITPRHFLHAGPSEEIFENFCDGKDKEHIVLPTR